MIPVEDFEKQEVKDLILNEEWWYYTIWDSTYFGPEQKYSTFDEALIQLKGHKGEILTHKPTVRWFLQHLGTDAVRNNLHPNAWVNALMSEYKNKWEELNKTRTAIHEIKGEEYPNWIITDMRFPNELEAVKSRGGICIRIIRKFSKNPELDFPKAFLHESETALDNHQFDYEIINDGSIQDLIDKVRVILQQNNII